MKNVLRQTTACLALVMGVTGGAAFAQSTSGEISPILPLHGDIDPFYGDIDPFHGDIDPFYGDIDAFHGDISPFHGDINPFHGDINPFYGDISPFWGDISPFWGDISPFHGDISPFHGDISPFHGDIYPFHGDIHPFWGDINPFHGDINPFHGDIAPFWGDIGPFWGDINSSWNALDPVNSTRRDYRRVLKDIKRMFRDARQTWAPIIGDGKRGRGRRAFNADFMEPLLERYGIDLTDPDSLRDMDGRDRSAFFLDFYDGLMGYAQSDRVDHWMATVNWSPRISANVGGGKDVMVGLIDLSLPGSYDLNISLHGESPTQAYLGSNHGIAVASLIGARHDGQGLMGVAPEVQFALYNPFDETLTTNWTDVQTGLNVLLDEKHADVINLSLGVAGWTLPQDWASTFAALDTEYPLSETLFVVAAGNDGMAQVTNLDWTASPVLDNLLVVGSVNPVGQVSRFSNRPGTACLLINNQCGEGQRLMDRFLVAPGELILAQGGEVDAGLTRVSGTSFAAPLVTGAAALVKGRWQWLQANEVADILLMSAQDLGAPGVDEVYGWGLLDIAGALAPLDTDHLYHLGADNYEQTIGNMGLRLGTLDFNPRDDQHIVVIEPIGSTYRDFEVPLSTLTATGETGQWGEQAQITEYAYTGTQGTAFSNIVEFERTLSRRGDVEIVALAAQRDPRAETSESQLPFQLGVSLHNTVNGGELRAGIGEGALALTQQSGFGLFSDHRPETGGVNPILGLASGGVYGLAGFKMSENTRLSVGVSTVRDEHLFTSPFTGEETPLYPGMDAYEAQAFVIDMAHQAGEAVSLHASYTVLNETSGLLGAQGSDILSFEGGSVTDALTFGSEMIFDYGLDLSLSATMARTRSTAFGGGVLDLANDVYSSAYQASLRRSSLFWDYDAVRLSLIQPLHVEDGAIRYTGTRIIDRDTGELGLVSQDWELGGMRPTVLEVMYASPLPGAQADITLFNRFEVSGEQISEQRVGLLSGVRFELKF
ncbi:S8 family peptidase [Maricaulis sp.]|uniref:S8 family peptidase n=1 Tax=Maricaulis sp. TaxID=1486257 RepID=UPI00262B5AF8|nr:S8 family peptidase [Maricaulis sp.]